MLLFCVSSIHASHLVLTELILKLSFNLMFNPGVILTNRLNESFFFHSAGGALQFHNA